MKASRTLLILCFTALLSLIGMPTRAQPSDYDVVVYTATASGVMAAIAAAQAGSRVVLVEPGKHIGGMVTGGLSHTDYGNRTVIGGLALEFYQRVAEHYGTHPFYWRGPEPHIGEEILKDWLDEAGVEVQYEKRLDEVEMASGVIQQLTFLDGSQITGRVFIDAGYEGDLIAKAGVSYVVGREGVADYGESWAGRQPITFTSHQIDARLSPYADERAKELLPLIHPDTMVDIGQADGGVQSYGFRMIATDHPDNLLPWPKPDNYDPVTFELVRRYYQAQPKAGPLVGFWPTLPNRKSDINSSVGISTNLLDGSNWKYPDADYALRDSIWKWHQDYTLGLAYYLANDPAVPEPVRQAMTTFGLCKDEYVENEHFPHQLYVRVGRRMKGEYFMTQHDLTEDTLKYDAIGMGSYNMDVRHVQRSWLTISRFPDLKEEVYNEGYLSIPVSPYEIPYRSLTPRFEECRNLLSSVCVSGSHLAIASIRMEPQYMIMGHAAGLAAHMAAQSNRPVQLVDVYALQQTLSEQGQVLSLEKNPYGSINTPTDIVIDNTMTNFTNIIGDWYEEETMPTGRYEMNFRYSPPGKTGSFEYHPYLFESGLYNVFMWHPADAQYSDAVTVTVHTADKTLKKQINQQKGGGEWKKLGAFNFKKGKQLALSIEANENQMVIADAVRFLKDNDE